MSSSGPAITPMSAPTGAFPPAGTRILRRTPAPRASISMLALSVSISASTSPCLTVSPSCLLHLTTVPSSIVGESLARMTLVTIAARGSTVEHLLHGGHDFLRLREVGFFERLGVGHRHVGGRDPHDRGVEGIEALALDPVGDLGAETGHGPALFD